MKKKLNNKEIEKKMLSDLNDFMKDFGIDEISFGNTHKIVKTKGKKAKDIIKKNEK